MTPDDRPRRRRLTEDERALWRGITRAIVPLKRRPRNAEAVEPDAPQKPADKLRRTRPAPAATAIPARAAPVPK
ncbi:MAG: Smr/MutS family protein, partial [Xanthobacteraceae bacterium]